MAYAIYGSKEQALNAKMKLEEVAPNINVDYFIDNASFDRLGDCIHKATVISLHKAKKLYRENILEGVIVPSTYPNEIYNSMVDCCLGIGMNKKQVLTMPINILRGG